MTHPPEAGVDADVVRFHTRGVRFPRLIGKTADGTRLPGGPYTITQVVATVTVFIAGQWTRPLWGGNGLATDYLILTAVAVAIGFALRHTSFGPRDPVTTAIAVVTLYLTPRSGRRNGRALRAIRPTRPRRAAPPRWLVPEPASAEPTVTSRAVSVDA